MHHRIGRDVDGAERAALLRLEGNDRKIELLFRFRRMLEQRFHHLGEPRFDTFRACNYQRTGPPRELRIEQKEWQAGEMIAVERRDQDQLDIVANDAKPLQGRQRGGAAIDQEIGGIARDAKAGILPAAGAERIAAADKLQLHLTWSTFGWPIVCA
jgi:hypothetical protein